MTLFLTSCFTAIAPQYALYHGQYLKVTFLYVLAFYAVLFFTEHMSMDQMRKAGVFVRAQNHNETHYMAVALGLGLGVLLRRRIRSQLYK